MHPGCGARLDCVVEVQGRRVSLAVRYFKLSAFEIWDLCAELQSDSYGLLQRIRERRLSPAIIVDVVSGARYIVSGIWANGGAAASASASTSARDASAADDVP